MQGRAILATLRARLVVRAKSGLRQHGGRLGLVFLLALLSLRAVRGSTGGELAVPLDDAFIHFQYARSFWEGRGFSYTPGAVPAPGATSLVWPLLLAVPYGLGLRGELIILAAWLCGWAALAMLAYETRRAGDHLLSRDGALAAELMVLAFGGYVWFAASGMEVLPLAWILLRTARRTAEWAEASPGARPSGRELVALAWLAPLVRPEGVLATASVALTMLLAGRGAQRALGLLAVTGAALPGIVHRIFTGQSTTTTATVKWLPLNPYLGGTELFERISDNVKLLFGTLLNGEVWSAVFLPQGSAVLLWPALPALVLAGLRMRARRRATLLLVVALGMLIPTTYDSFLWNRLRYLWPFMSAWFLGVAALADLAGAALARFGRSERFRLLVSGVALGGLLSRLGWTLEDLGTSSNAIRLQQVSLGRWAADALPSGAVIGVNDTGAIAYFSERRVFDVVGLTTAREARYWVAGAGSRFEHYERLGASKLPTHFVVYPNWFAIPALLGPYLTQRSVPGATILGGETMVAHAASYAALGSGARPRLAESCVVVDELDVADLESEAEHDYDVLGGTSATNLVFESDGVVDGGRSARTLERFSLSIVPGGRVVSRVGSELPNTLELVIGGRVVGRQGVEAAGLREIVWQIPAAPSRRLARIELRARGGPFSATHHWSLADCRP